MVITRISTKGKRCIVEFDERDPLTLEQDLVMMYVLFTGKELSEEQYGEIAAEQEFLTAMAAAHRFIGYRARSEREVRDRLRQKHIAPAAVQRAILRLRETGVLDDSEFGGKFVHDALLRKPVGRIRLKMDLRRKGLDDAAIDRALNMRYDTVSEIEAARALSAKRLRTRAGQAPAAQRAALAQYLRSRGFTREAIDASIAAIDEPERTPDEEA